MIRHLGAFGTHISHSRAIWHSATPRACPYKFKWVCEGYVESDMTYFKYCRRLSYYKHGEYMEPPCSVRPIAEWCIFGIEVYSGTGQLSFLSPRGGKYIEIPRGVRNRHGVLSFGGTYMEVSFDADVATEHGIRAAVVLNHIAHLMRLPDGSQVGYFKSCGRATATGTR